MNIMYRRSIESLCPMGQSLTNELLISSCGNPYHFGIVPRRAFPVDDATIYTWLIYLCYIPLTTIDPIIYVGMEDCFTIEYSRISFKYNPDALKLIRPLVRKDVVHID